MEKPRSVPAITARRRDSRQRIEIEFSNGLERVGGRRAAQRLWQGFKPGGVGGLERQQFGNRVVPALKERLHLPVREQHPCPAATSAARSSSRHRSQCGHTASTRWTFT